MTGEGSVRRFRGSDASPGGEEETGFEEGVDLAQGGLLVQAVFRQGLVERHTRQDEVLPLGLQGTVQAGGTGRKKILIALLHPGGKEQDLAVPMALRHSACPVIEVRHGSHRADVPRCRRRP